MTKYKEIIEELMTRLQFVANLKLWEHLRKDNPDGVDFCFPDADFSVSIIFHD